MHKLIGHFRQRGTQRMVGEILRENSRMLQLAQSLGFKVQPRALGDDTQKVVLDLQSPG